MNNRLEFHSLLKTLIGPRSDGEKNVYFQPPESVKIVYPCIIYELSRGNSKYADNKTYTFRRGYDVKYVTKDPDDPFVEKIPYSFIMCSFDRHYVNNNLHYFVFKIFY